MFLKGTSKYFKNFIVSSAIIMIFMVTLSLVCSIFFENIYKKNIDKNARYLIKQSSTLFEKRLKSIEKVIADISVNEEMDMLLKNDNTLLEIEPLETASIIDRLSYYKSTCEYISDIFVFEKSSGAVVTDQGFYNNSDDFFQYVLEVPKNKLTELMDEFYNSESLSLYYYCYNDANANAKKNSHVQMSLTVGTEPKGDYLICAVIKGSILDNLLYGSDNIEDQTISLFLNEENRIVLSNVDKDVLSENLSQIVGERNNYVELFSKRFYMYKHYVTKYGLTYYQLVPEEAISRDLNGMRKIMIVIIFVGIILLSLAIFIGKKNYNYAYSITEKLKEIHGDNIEDKIKNLESAIHTLVPEQNKFKHLINETHNIIRDEFFRKIIIGQSWDKLDKNVLWDELHSDFSQKNVTVIKIIFSSKVAKSHEEICTLIEDLSNENINVYSFVHNDAVVVIIAASLLNPELNEEIYYLCAALTSFLEEEFQLHANIGLGRTYTSLTGIQKSYFEAEYALRYISKNQCGDIFRYADIDNVVDTYNYTNSMELDLRNCLKEGDLKKANEVLGEIISINLKNNTHISLEVARCLFVEIKGTIMKVCNRFDGEDKLLLSDLTELIRANTINSMINVIYSDVEKLCEIVNQSKTTHSEAMKERIIAFIESRRENFNFDLTSIADELGVTSSYVSKFFKKHMNENYIDYLRKMKIERAKELLEDTSLTIAQIARMLSFSNSSVLIKNFKKEVGITPREYRDNLKGENS